MGIKRITTCVALLLFIFSAAQAQEIRTDSVGDSNESRNGQTDSLQILSNELAQIKSRLNADEHDKQIEKIWKRKKYWKLGFGNPNIERTDGEEMKWKTEFAISLQRGKTAYLHSKPLWGMVKFGIDYGFVDLSYAKLKLKSVKQSGTSSSIPGTPSGSNPGGFDEIVSDDPSGSIIGLMGVDLGMHKFEYSMHAGPSVSLNPWNHLIVAAYFHVMPTASGIVENDTFSYGFGCAFSAGMSVSYKALSVGVEGLWCTIKYKQTSFDDDDDEYDDGYESEEDFKLFNTKNFKLKQSGPRFYVALRF